MWRRIFPYLQLMRPANLITAVADVAAGYAVCGGVVALQFFPTHIHLLQPVNLIWLCIATIGLYGGGVVMNDVFDVDIDKIERPERPLPSGRATVSGAILLSVVLFLLAFFCAFQVSNTSGFIAIGIAAAALVYDKYGKHTSLGPLNMGVCRGLNLALGMAYGFQYWYVCLLPIAYITAITLVSKGEVYGGSKRNYLYAFLLYSLVLLAIGFLAFRSSAPWVSLVFLALFGYKILPTLYQAYLTNEPRKIMIAVKTGVISLIIMDASLGACFAGGIWGAMILLLLPVSIYLAKKFAVT